MVLKVCKLAVDQVSVRRGTTVLEVHHQPLQIMTKLAGCAHLDTIVPRELPNRKNVHLVHFLLHLVTLKKETVSNVMQGSIVMTGA